MSLKDVQFFGEADRVNGKIGSNYPGWYHTTRIQEMAEDIERTERELERGVYPNDRIPHVKDDLGKRKERLQMILEARPNLSDKERDAVAKYYAELGNTIRDMMPTYTEMQKGWANIHEEANKESLPCIDVAGRKEFLENMGIRVVKGKINRNQACQAFKIMGRALGENTVIERLRKDANYGVYHNEPRLEDMR